MRRGSCAAVVLAVLSIVSVVYGQTVEDIVARNLEAKGGADKWKAVTSVKMNGRVKMQGMEALMTVYAKRPNYTRQDIVLKDRKLVQAFDGTSGWFINPMMGSDAPQELPPPANDMMREGADFDGPLVNYKAKGHTIELVGTEKLDQTEVHHLKITMKGGQVQHYYLDAKTGIELRKSQEVDIGTGQKQTLETGMSDYRPVSGIMVPHRITQLVDGKPLVEMSIEQVEFNSAEVVDALFKMPGK